MAVLSSSYILLVALVQNVFYAHMPYDVMDASIMLETKNFSSGDTWMKMNYQVIHNLHTPVFTIRIPPSASCYLRYKIKLQFRNQSFGETPWKTLITEDFKNHTQCDNSTTIPTAAMDNNSCDIFGLMAFIAVMCTILLINLMYGVFIKKLFRM